MHSINVIRSRRFCQKSRILNLFFFFFFLFIPSSFYSLSYPTYFKPLANLLPCFKPCLLTPPPNQCSGVIFNISQCKLRAITLIVDLTAIAANSVKIKLGIVGGGPEIEGGNCGGGKKVGNLILSFSYYFSRLS